MRAAREASSSSAVPSGERRGGSVRAGSGGSVGEGWFWRGAYGLGRTQQGEGGGGLGQDLDDGRGDELVVPGPPEHVAG